MNDHKELIAHIHGDAAFRHIISECGADGRVWFDKRFICDYVSHLKYAIERLVKERDAEVADLEAIDNAPPVDAVSVRHGHWVEMKRGHYFKCSLCRNPIPYKFGWKFYNGVILNKRYYNYCPNCGAKMDGENNEDRV